MSPFCHSKIISYQTATVKAFEGGGFLPSSFKKTAGLLIQPSFWNMQSVKL